MTGVVLYFIKVKGQQPGPRIEEAFEILIEKMEEEQNCHWIEESECYSFKEKKSRHIFVFEEFGTEAFNHIVSTGNKCYGPTCIVACLKNNEALPTAHPTFCLSMKNCVISCTSVSKDEREMLVHQIKWMSGNISKDFHDGVTHLVAGEVGSKKYRVAANLAKQIMSPKWIHAVMELSKTKIVSANDALLLKKYKCPVFLGLVITVSGLESKERNQVKEMVESDGGQYKGEMKMDECTHLVVSKPRGQKYEFAKKWKLHIVNPKWVSDSLDIGYCLEEMRYKVTENCDETLPQPTSTPTQPRPSGRMSRLSTLGDVSAISVTHIDDTTQFNHTVNQSLQNQGGGRPANKDPLESLDLVGWKGDYFLDGCKIYLSGFSSYQMEKLKKMLNLGGAVRLNDITDTLTHIIVGVRIEEHVKQIEAMSTRPHVVTLDWLIESFKAVKCVPENMFYYLDLLQVEPHLSKVKLKKKTSTVHPLNIDGDSSFQAPPTSTPMDADGMQDVMSQYLPQNQDSNTFGESTLFRMAEDMEAGALNQEEPSTSRNNTVTATSTSSKTSPEKDVEQQNFEDMETQDPNDVTELQEDEDDEDLPFKGKSFVIIGFNEEQSSDLHKFINECGGQIAPLNTRKIPDYAVVPIMGCPVEKTVHEIVTNAWLQISVEQGKIQPIEENDIYTPLNPKDELSLPLDGCVLSISGYVGTERDVISHIAQILGAVCQDFFVRKAQPHKNLLANTHLIVNSAEGSKYQAALKWNIPAVEKSWVIQCTKQSKKLPEEDYLVGGVKKTQQTEKEQTKSTPEQPNQKSNNLQDNQKRTASQEIMPPPPTAPPVKKPRLSSDSLSDDNNKLLDNKDNQSKEILSKHQQEQPAVEEEEKDEETSGSDTDGGNNRRTRNKRLTRDSNKVNSEKSSVEVSGTAPRRATRRNQTRRSSSSEDEQKQNENVQIQNERKATLTNTNSSSASRKQFNSSKSSDDMDTSVKEDASVSLHFKTDNEDERDMSTNDESHDVSDQVTDESFHEVQPIPQRENLQEINTHITPKAIHPKIQKLKSENRKSSPKTKDTSGEESDGWETPSKFLTEGVMYRPEFDLEDAMACVDAMNTPGRTPREHRRKSSISLEEMFSMQLDVAIKNTSVKQNFVEQLPPDSPAVFRRGTPRPLNCVVIAVSKKLLAKQMDYNSIAESLGADYKWTYDSSCTHYIFQGRQNDINKEFRKAREDKKIIVSPHWLMACQEENCRIDESLYPHTYNPNLSLSISSTKTPARATRATRSRARVQEDDDTPLKPRNTRAGKKQSKNQENVLTETSGSKKQPTKSQTSQVTSSNNHQKNVKPETLSSPETSKENKKSSRRSDESVRRDMTSELDHSQSDDDISKVCDDMETSEVNNSNSNSLVKDLKKLMSMKGKSYGKQRGPKFQRSELSYDKLKDDLSYNNTPTSASKRSRPSSRNNSQLDDSDDLPVKKGRLSRNNSNAAAIQETQASQMIEVTWDDPKAREQQEKLAMDLAKYSQSLSPGTEHPGPLKTGSTSALDRVEIEMPTSGATEDAQNTWGRTPSPEPPSLALPVPKSRNVSPPKPVDVLTDSDHNDTTKEEEVDEQEDQQVLFQMSGIDQKERYDYASLISDLDGDVSEAQYYDPQTTHLVVEQPSRNEKYLACMAAGKWILHKSFFEACRQENAFVKEDAYEWGSEYTTSICTGASQLKLAQSAHRWRTKLHKTRQNNPSCTGAFDGWKVLLVAKREQQFVRLLEAGGAEIVSTVLPFPKLDGVTHAFLDWNHLKVDVGIASLMSAGIHCCKLEYISAYLTEEPCPQPNMFYVDGVRELQGTSESSGRKRKSSTTELTGTPNKRKKQY